MNKSFLCSVGTRLFWVLRWVVKQSRGKAWTTAAVTRTTCPVTLNAGMKEEKVWSLRSKNTPTSDAAFLLHPCKLQRARQADGACCLRGAELHEIKLLQDCCTPGGQDPRSGCCWQEQDTAAPATYSSGAGSCEHMLVFLSLPWQHQLQGSARLQQAVWLLRARPSAGRASRLRQVTGLPLHGTRADLLPSGTCRKAVLCMHPRKSPEASVPLPASPQVTIAQLGTADCTCGCTPGISLKPYSHVTKSPCNFCCTGLSLTWG